MEIPLIFGLCHYLWCRRGNNHFDVHFRRIGPVPFLSKDGKRGPWEKKWMEECLIPARVGIFSFVKLWLKYFSLFVPWFGV